MKISYDLAALPERRNGGKESEPYRGIHRRGHVEGPL